MTLSQQQQKERLYQHSKAAAVDFFETFKNEPSIVKLHRNCRKNGKKFTVDEWLAQHGVDQNTDLGQRLHTWFDAHQSDNIILSFSRDPKHPDTIQPHGQRLGKGAFGKVRDTDNNHVIKVINIDDIAAKQSLTVSLNSLTTIRQIWQKTPPDKQRQYRAAAMVTHIAPEIDRLHDLGELVGTPYVSVNHKGQHKLYLTLINHGPSLDRIDKRIDADLSMQQAITFLLRLHHIHTGEASLTHTKAAHQDVKDANITIDSDEEPHLIDFGFASTTPSKRPNRLYGTLAYLSPIVWEQSLTPIQCDLIAAARCCYYPLSTDSAGRYRGLVSRYLFDSLLPKTLLPHLTDNNPSIIALLSTSELYSTNSRLHNQFGPLPTSALEYAAKLALLRKDPEADISTLTVAPALQQRAIVALSLANFNNDHAIWDHVLTTENRDLWQAIVLLDTFDRSLVTNDRLSDTMCTTDVIQHLATLISASTPEESVQYHQELQDHRNPNFLKRAVIALSVAKLPTDHVLWQHAIVNNHRPLQKSITRINLMDLQNVDEDKTAVIKALTIDALREAARAGTLSKDQQHYVHHIIPVINDCEEVDTAITHAKQAARITSHRDWKPRSINHKTSEAYFETIRQLANIDQTTWDRMLTNTKDSEGIQTYRHFKASNPTLFQKPTTQHVADTPWVVIPGAQI